MCESIDVSPCPGKCFAQLIKLAFSMILIYFDPNHDTTSGSSEKARVQMIGLLGSLFTSITGISGILIPISMASVTMALIRFSRILMSLRLFLSDCRRNSHLTWEDRAILYLLSYTTFNIRCYKKWYF